RTRWRRGGAARSFGQSRKPQPLVKRLGNPRHLERAVHVELMVPPHVLDGIARRVLEEACDNLVRLLYPTQGCEAGRPIAKHGRGVGLFTKNSSRPIQHLVMLPHAKV